MCIVSEINGCIDTLYTGVLSSAIRYMWNDLNSHRSTETFTSVISSQINTLIVFANDVLQLFNIKPDFPQSLTLIGYQRSSIPFDSTYNYSFLVLDIIQLFLHANFNNAKYNNVSKNNELYHKLVKQYSLLQDSFYVWFCLNDTRLIAPEIDLF
jgi:hypothetical protein